MADAPKEPAGGPEGSMLHKLYFSLEDRYYDAMDALESHGLPVHAGFITPIEERGIPSFVVAGILALLIIAGIGFFAWGMLNQGPTTVNFIARVQSDAGDVNNATILVYQGDALLAKATTVNGVASIPNLPAALLSFSVSAPGFVSTDRAVDLFVDARHIFYLSCKGPCPISGPTPTPQPGVIPTPIPPATYSPPKIFPKPGPRNATGSSVDVTVLDSSSAGLVPNAVVTLKDADSFAVLGTKTAAAGYTFFDGVTVGRRVFVTVNAPGYLPYDGSSAPVQTVRGVTNLMALVSAANAQNSISTPFEIRDENNVLTSAFLQIFVNNSAAEYSELNVTNGTASVPTPAGVSGYAIVSKDNYSTNRQPFVSGSPVVVRLSRRPVILAPSCDVVLPDYPNPAVQLPQGKRVNVRVDLVNLSVSSAVVHCGQANTTAACSGTACNSSCVFDGTGSLVVDAIASNISCVPLQSVLVVPRTAPGCSLSLSPAVVPVGSGARVFASYGDIGPIPGNFLNIDCGNGRSVTATSCANNAGSCSAQCPAYPQGRSYAVTTRINGVSCGATLTAVDSIPTDLCTIAVLPPTVGVNQSVSLSLSYTLSNPATAPATVYCGDAPASPVTCAGKSGSCTTSCAFLATGEQAVVARIGNASCATGAQVLDSPQTTPYCTIIPSPSTSFVANEVTLNYTFGNLASSPAPADFAPACDILAPASAILLGQNGFSASCNYTTPGFKQPGGRIGSLSCAMPTGESLSVVIAPPQACSDGTHLNSCSAVRKPDYCNAVGSLVDNASACGCPASNPVVDGNSCRPAAPSCSGANGGRIPIGSCTANLPEYCSPAGALVSNSSFCGCPAGSVAQGNSCAVTNPSCNPADTSCLVGNPACKAPDGSFYPNRCLSPRPLYCDNLANLTVNSQACGCEGTDIALADGRCIPKQVSCDDGTPALACSNPGLPNTRGKPWYCTADGVSVPNATMCGCPNGFHQTPGADSCDPSIPPFGGSCQVILRGGSQYSVNVFVPLSAVFTGFGSDAGLSDFDAAELDCGANDNSGWGVPAKVGSCRTLADGSSQCDYTCQYAFGANGTKNSSAFVVARGMRVACKEAAFAIAPLPGTWCTVNPSSTSLSLGQSASVSVSYSNVQDDSGTPIAFAGPSSGYAFTCGKAFGSGTGQSDIPPQAPLDCRGSNGACTTACLYSPSLVDLNRTTRVSPRFDAFTGLPYAFACVSRSPISFADVPATARVRVSYLGKPVPGAEVALKEIVSSGTSSQELLCAIGTTGSDGSISFPGCTDSNGNFAHSLLQGELVSASVSYNPPAGVNLRGSASTILSLPLGSENVVTVPVGLPSASVHFTLADAFTGGLTDNLSHARITTYCQTLDPASGQFIGDALALDSGTYSTKKTYAINASAVCLVNVTAPNYLPLSDFILPTAGENQALDVTLPPFAPLSAGVTSLFSLSSLRDVEDTGDYLNLGAPLSLKKGFTYEAQLRLNVLNTSNEVGAYFEASSSDAAPGLIYNASKPRSFIAAKSLGQPATTSLATCSAAPFDPSFNSGQSFNWIDWRAFNNVGGLPNSGTYSYSFLVDQNSLATRSSMHFRSYTFNASLSPSYALSPFDSQATLLAAAFQPWCLAKSNSVDFALADSNRACSPSGAYCTSLSFRQDGSSISRGDGFTAQSAQRCNDDPLNALQCRNVTASFTLTNHDVDSQTLQSSYSFSVSTNNSHMRLRGISFGGSLWTKAGDGNGALTFINESMATVDLVRVYESVGYSTDLSGFLILTPWLPTDPAPPLDRVNVSLQFTSPGDGVSRDSWMRVVPASGVLTRFAQVDAPTLSQEEQLDPLRTGRGYDVQIAGFFVNGSKEYAPPAASILNDNERASIFEASIDDCASSPAGTQGWGCTPLNFSGVVHVLQDSPDARLNVALPPAFVFQSASYAVLDSSKHSILPSPRMLSSPSDAHAGEKYSPTAFNISVGPVTYGQTIAYTLLLRALSPSGTPAVPAERMNLSFENGPDKQGGSLNVSTWLKSAFHYGLLKLQAIDSSTNPSNPIPVTGAQFRFSYYFDNGAVPVPHDFGACTDSATSSCIYRLRPTLWSSAACPTGSESATGCATASKPGFFSSPHVPALAQSISGQATADGAVIAHKQTVLNLPLFPMQGKLSAITGYSILDKSTKTVICSSPAASPLPDCTASGVFLGKGKDYAITLNLGLDSSVISAGVLLSLGSDASTSAHFNALPTTAGSSTPITGYAIGTQFPPATGCPPNFAAANPIDPSNPNPPLSSWSQVLFSPAVGATGATLTYEFHVDEPAVNPSDALTLSMSTVAGKQDINGNTLYFHQPLATGQDGTNSLASWCSAPVSTMNIAIGDPNQHCSGTVCGSLSFEQAGNSGGTGFEAVSKTLWQYYLSTSPASLHIPISVTFSSPPSGPLSFHLKTSAPSHLAFTNLAFTAFCGKPASGIPSGQDFGDGVSEFAYSLPACSSTGAANAVKAIVSAWPLDANAVDPTAADGQTPVEFSLTDSSGATAFSLAPFPWIHVGPPVGTYGGAADLAVSADQTAADGNNHHDGGTGSSLFYALTGTNCDATGVENTYRGTAATGGNSCAEAYLELSYGITSNRNVGSAVFSFAIPPEFKADGITPIDRQPLRLLDWPVPTPTLAVYKVDASTQGGRKLLYQCSPSTQGPCSFQKLSTGPVMGATFSVSPVSKGDQFIAVYRLLPMAGTTLLPPKSVSLSFASGSESSSLVIPLKIVSRTPVISSPPVPPLFPCGNIGISLKSQIGANGYQFDASCSDINLFVDPIFPADGIPVTADDSFVKACGKIFDTGTFRFAPPDDKTLVDLSAGARSTLQGDVNTGALKLMPPGPGNPITVSGNSVYVNGNLVPINGVVGGAKLVFTCPAASRQVVSVNIKVTVSKFSSAAGLAALDGSYAFFAGQPHELIYTSYNGQLPASIVVKSANVKATLPFPASKLSPGNRVEYFLVNNGQVGGTQQSTANNYPVQVYPDGGVPEDGVNPSITSSTYRDGSFYSALVGLVHSDPQVNELFSSAYLDQLPHSITSQNDIAAGALPYVSSVYRNLPGMFKNIARHAGEQTAFRHSPAADAVYYYGEEFDLPADASSRISCDESTPSQPTVWVSADNGRFKWQPDYARDDGGKGAWINPVTNAVAYPVFTAMQTRGTQFFAGPEDWYSVVMAACSLPTTCQSCRPVSGDPTQHLSGVPTEYYEYTSHPAVEPFSFSVAGTTPFIPAPDSTPYGSQIRSTGTYSIVSTAYGDATNVFLEYKHAGDATCDTVPTGDPTRGWCTDGKVFGNALPAKLASTGGHWSIDEPISASSAGTWAIRLRGEDASGAVKGYSVPQRFFVTTDNSNICFDSPGRTGIQNDPFECGGSLCATDCVNGQHSLVGPRIPVLLPLFKVPPLHAPLPDKLAQEAKKYAGIPYTYFSPGQPFSYSAPLMLWGWDTTSLTADPQYKNLGNAPVCNSGVGFYELSASSSNGVSYDYSYVLKRLPLDHYLLAKENSNAGPSDLFSANSQSPQGCSTVTDKQEPWTVNINNPQKAGIPLQQFSYPPLVAANSKFTDVGDSTSVYQDDSKWLCNIANVFIQKHDHLWDGQADCVVHCPSAFCGNCGLPIPACLASSELSRIQSALTSSPPACVKAGAISESCLHDLFIPPGAPVVSSNAMAGFYTLSNLRQLAADPASGAACQGPEYPAPRKSPDTALRFTLSCANKAWLAYTGSGQYSYCTKYSPIPPRVSRFDVCYASSVVISD